MISSSKFLFTHFKPVIIDEGISIFFSFWCPTSRFDSKKVDFRSSKKVFSETTEKFLGDFWFFSENRFPAMAFLLCRLSIFFAMVWKWHFEKSEIDPKWALKPYLLAHKLLTEKVAFVLFKEPFFLAVVSLEIVFMELKDLGKEIQLKSRFISIIGLGKS